MTVSLCNPTLAGMRESLCSFPFCSSQNRALQLSVIFQVGRWSTKKWRTAVRCVTTPPPRHSHYWTCSHLRSALEERNHILQMFYVANCYQRLLPVLPVSTNKINSQLQIFPLAFKSGQMSHSRQSKMEKNVTYYYETNVLFIWQIVFC